MALNMARAPSLFGCPALAESPDFQSPSASLTADMKSMCSYGHVLSVASVCRSTSTSHVS